MMSIKQKLTGKPSIDRPWMQYYPQEMIENLTVPNSTLYEYLMYNCPGDDVVAIHYYGRDITWKQIKEETDKVARALKAVGFGENDEIPMFLRSVPEFIFLLLGAEKIGASLLCRDNTIEENVAAVKKAGAKIIFAHDFLSQEDFNKFRACGVREAILLSPLRSADKSTLPDYSWDFLASNSLPSHSVQETVTSASVLSSFHVAVAFPYVCSAVSPSGRDDCASKHFVHK